MTHPFDQDQLGAGVDDHRIEWNGDLILGHVGGFGRRQHLHIGNVEYFVGSLVDALHDKLTEQIARALAESVAPLRDHSDQVVLSLTGGRDSRLIAAALIATLSPIAAAAVRSSVVHREARVITTQVEHLLSSSFSAQELRYGLSKRTREQLDVVNAQARTVGRFYVRLWNRDGVLSGDEVRLDVDRVARRFPLVDDRAR